jgi:hypothetical protein
LKDAIEHYLERHPKELEEFALKAGYAKLPSVESWATAFDDIDISSEQVRQLKRILQLPIPSEEDLKKCILEESRPRFLQ